MTTNKKCPQCNHKIDDDIKFCPNCGERLQEATPREPGELKIMLNKIHNATKNNKSDNAIMTLVISMAIISTLHWALGEHNDENWNEIVILTLI